MRKQITLVISVFLLINPIVHITAQSYTIGADNGQNSQYQYPTPFGNYYKTQRTQHLYRASELTAAGMTAGYITEISWNVISLPGGVDVTEDYTIKLLSTGTSSLSLTTWIEGATTVWGPTDYTPVVGENSFTLLTPFFWDGSSNLVIEICGGDYNLIYTKNARVTWTGPLAFNGSHTRQSDTEPAPCSYAGIDYYSGTPGGPTYRPQVTLTRIDAENCTGMPAVSPAESTELSVCPDEEFTLSIDAIVEGGITYHWQKSADGVLWSDIAGATGSTYTTTQDAQTLYRCFVTCTYSGMSATSAYVAVMETDPTACYCVPIYTTGTGLGDYVSNVVLEDISNPTVGSPTPFYTYYDDEETELFVDSVYTITISDGTYATNNGLAAWIDYNQDGDFTDAGEKLGEATGLVAYATINLNFTVPLTALTGDTRLRVRDVWNQIAIDPCATYGYGETEDYVIHISPGFPPEANFTFSGDPMVTFTDLSTHTPTSWSWNFDDLSTSTLQNPTHLFASNGTYNVCLVATNALGSDTYCADVVIDTYLPPAAAFSFSGDPDVAFTDLSSEDPTSWYWDFGDLTTSNLQNPDHVYATNGTYYVCLTATNDVGSNTSCQFVLIDSYVFAPDADFTYFGDPIVFFVDFSTEDPSTWYWDFGDGESSVEENPEHTYTENGTYIACLTATNDVGSDTQCQTLVIDGYPAPDGLFTYTGDPTVTFTDLSTNDPESWIWDFDDGSFSAEQNPVHAFALNDVYTVCLTVSGAGGADTYCDNIEIEMAQLAPVTDFYFTLDGGYTVSFFDMSGNEPTDWTWQFGDGSISLLQNPSHTYATGGLYTTCLTTSNAIGNDMECKTVDLPQSVGTIELNNENIFPNPAHNSITIACDCNLLNSKIELIDMLGRVIDNGLFNIINTSGSSIQLSIENLPAGEYVIKIITDEAIMAGSFVKE